MKRKKEDRMILSIRILSKEAERLRKLAKDHRLTVGNALSVMMDKWEQSK